MRALPTLLQAKLNSGVTTLCRCWLITRSDGLVQGFTDHDEDITLGGAVCRAGTGLTASEATQRLGLAVDGSEFSGALNAETLNEKDLAAGRYDAAQVELWLVDWSEPELRVLLASGSLGDVRRDGKAFTAEMRSLSQRLSEVSGRLYTATCSADLGDARCAIDLAIPLYRANGTVTALTGISNFFAGGLEGFDDGWFTAGKLIFISGANAGLGAEIKSHRNGTAVAIDLWQAMPEPIAAGDTFAVTAGCDKQFATCRNRFNNVANFRGFPHMPGNDFVIRYPVQGEPGNDGSSMQD